MINFKGRNCAIQQADRITRSVHSIYPHVSESMTRINIENYILKHSENQKQNYMLSGLKLKNSIKIDTLRFRGGFGLEQFKIIIENLKKHRFGNCYEESVLAQIIGKINGQKNIYPASIYYTKNSSGMNIEFDHAVAIITDKPFEKNYKYEFKNKDAIVIDPWIGITQFAGEYFKSLRTQFNKLFTNKISDNDYLFKHIAQTSNNIKEFNLKRKECFKPKFYFKLHDDEILSQNDAEELKKEYPELILNNFKVITL